MILDMPMKQLFSVYGKFAACLGRKNGIIRKENDYGEDVDENPEQKHKGSLAKERTSCL